MTIRSRTPITPYMVDFAKPQMQGLISQPKALRLDTPRAAAADQAEAVNSSRPCTSRDLHFMDCGVTPVSPPSPTAVRDPEDFHNPLHSMQRRGWRNGRSTSRNGLLAFKLLSKISSANHSGSAARCSLQLFVCLPSTLGGLTRRVCRRSSV